MQANDFYKYVAEPRLLDKNSVAELQQLVTDFPYFQSAHLLLSLASKKWDASVYQQSLKKTAIVAGNRAHLFHLIHQLENEPEIKETIKKAIEPLTEQSVVKEKQATESVSVKQENKIEENVLPEINVPVDNDTSVKEEVAQELDILKAAEVSVETSIQKSQNEPQIQFEKEIEKQVVNSFVEKEILKTPDLNKPLATSEKPESFNDWLSFLKKNNGQPNQDIRKRADKSKTISSDKQGEKKPDIEKTMSQKQKNKALIDRIIEKNPGLIRTREEQKFYTPDLKAKESLLENEHLVTETLARIYALQGNVNKAVRAYDILSLKYPQKSAYFASLIEKLKNNH